MARDFSKYQRGIVNRYYEHKDTIQANRLSEIVSQLWLNDDKASPAKLWKRAEQALISAGVHQAEIAAVIGKRDIRALAALVAKVDAGTAPKQPPSPDEPGKPAAPPPPPAGDTRTITEVRAAKMAEGGYDSLDEENLKRALKAFRRKLKAYRREDESQLRGRYVTKGQSSGINAITPPPEYPPAVWHKLVELGRLKKAREGTYELP